MGIFTRRPVTPVIDTELIAAAVAEHIKAAAPLAAPMPAPTTNDQRTAPFSGSTFGPGIPIIPIGLDPRDPTTGITDPRRYDYQTSDNLQLTETRAVPFKMLRDVADKVDVIRRCIELRKSQMLALDWDITLTDHATRRIMRDNGISSPGRAAQMARVEFEPEIIRLRDWWEKPDPINGMDFPTWLSTMLEELFVVDAVTVWPRLRLDRSVISFELIDGSTIKPLLDRRGAVPQRPAPAYQQILHGFPRGEYTATTDVDGEFFADQLVYRPRHRRTFSPYGLPETEAAITAANVYLKRMAWIRDEFDAGKTPNTWMKTPAGTEMTPGQMREWEDALNALLSDPMRRRELRMTPPGVEPEQMKDFADLYNPELDEFLIKLLCSCFDVMPTEIGFPPKSGIGGKGHQEGEANSSQRKAIRPTATWVQSLLTDLSREFLGMPRELQFSLLGYEIEDQESAEKVADSQQRRGALILNEDRAARGLPMLDFPEADTPFVVTPSGLVFLDGAIAAQAAARQQEPTVPGQEPVSATDPREPAPQDAAVEATKFLAFVRKGARRPFTFEHLTAIGDELNKAAADGDLDEVRRLLRPHLGKAKARRLSRADRARLIAAHAPLIRSKVAALLPAPSDLIAGWSRHPMSKAVDHAPAVAYVRSQLPVGWGDEYDELDNAIDTHLTGVHRAAWMATGFPQADDADTEKLDQLTGATSSLRDTLLTAVVEAVAAALLTTSQDLDQAIDDRVDTFTSGTTTDAATAGVLDASTANGTKWVRITATPECEFCADYEGRILGVDDNSGMPPLHNGCQCDIEPVTD